MDSTYWSEHYGFRGWGTAYVFGLTLLLVSLALLTFGLVRPWGEVLPRWIPFVGGDRVPRLAAIIPAGAGATPLTLLWITAFSKTPLLVWGPCSPR